MECCDKYVLLCRSQKSHSGLFFSPKHVECLNEVSHVATLSWTSMLTWLQVAWRTSAGRIFQKPRKPSRRLSEWLVVSVNSFEQDATAIWRLSCLLHGQQLIAYTEHTTYWPSPWMFSILSKINLKSKTKSNKQENICCWHKKKWNRGSPSTCLFRWTAFAQFKFPSCSGSMHHLRHSATHFCFLIRCSRCTHYERSAHLTTGQDDVCPGNAVLNTRVCSDQITVNYVNRSLRYAIFTFVYGWEKGRKWYVMAHLRPRILWPTPDARCQSQSCHSSEGIKAGMRCGAVTRWKDAMT